MLDIPGYYQPLPIPDFFNRRIKFQKVNLLFLLVISREVGIPYTHFIPPKVHLAFFIKSVST